MSHGQRYVVAVFFTFFEFLWTGLDLKAIMRGHGSTLFILLDLCLVSIWGFIAGMSATMWLAERKHLKGIGPVEDRDGEKGQ